MQRDICVFINNRLIGNLLYHYVNQKKKFTGYNLYDFNDASVHILALHISIINMISKRLFSVGNKKINSNYSQKKE